jgi:heme/copper-type cytochrome/quinol oxidase subunit 1
LRARPQKYVFKTRRDIERYFAGKTIECLLCGLAIVAGVIGGGFSILIRMELQEPGLQIKSPLL